MVNDTTTLNGALQELGETMAANLTQQGVTSSASEGLTTLAGKILDIQTGGGSCYHIEFSEDSYTAVGGSATLEIYLQENYAPKVGATVTVTGSDSSLYSGITNSQGIAEITVSNITGTVTFTCTYSNVSDTCSVTGSTYLFYDACDSSSGLSNYGSSECVRGSNASITMSYDSTENAYKVQGSGNYHAYVPITALKDKDEYVLSMDLKSFNIRYNKVGLFLDNYGDTTSYGCMFALNCYDKRLDYQQYRKSSDGSSSNTSVSSLQPDTWYRLEYTVNGSSLTGKLYTTAGTLLATKSVTLAVSNKSMGIFLFCESGSTSSTCYVRNIKAEPL